MKIKSAWIILLVCIMLVVVIGTAQAQQNDEAQIQTLLSQNSLHDPSQLQSWGNTAVCFAQKDGRDALCLFEKQDDRWQLVLCNENALRQGEQLPTLTLDSDNALFWTYLLQDKAVRFHAARGNDGVWGCVDETASFARGEVWYTYNVTWSSENGGEICQSAWIEDENGNDCTQNRSVRYLPAFWLNDCIRLDSFDLSRFPSRGFSGDYSDSWPGQAFLSEAAAALMPEYTYVNGVLRSGELHFLMEKPDDSRIYTVCHYGEIVPRKVQLQESRALPDDACLGVENFSDSLGIQKSNRIQAVSIQTFTTGGSGIGAVWNFNRESPLVFGQNCFYSDADRNVIWYGYHSWSDFVIIDWDSVPVSVEEAKNGFSSEEFAAVNNPDPQDRLHLREKPDKGSRSLGKYYNGTPALVTEVRGDWACVNVGDQSGWMMKKYLTFGKKDQPLRCDTSAMPQLMAKNNYELKIFTWPEEAYYSSSVFYVNAFSDPAYRNMKIIGIIGDEWYHVWFPENDEYGFVKQSDLWAGNG